MGRSVLINEGTLNDEDKKKYQDGWSKYQFNEYASSLISLHRNLPDVRPDA